MNTKTKPTKANENIEKLFDIINSVNLRKSPYRGLITKIAADNGSTSKISRQNVWLKIFKHRNVHLAVQLVKEIQSLDKYISKYVD